MRAILHSILIVLIVAACENTTNKNTSTKHVTVNLNLKPETRIIKERDSSEYEQIFIRNGLVNIHEMDTNIRVVLMYNSSKNFIGKSFYKGLNQCYLPCEVATKLNNAQKLLKQQFPFYNLIVFDATRPLHIQQLMWDSLKLHPLVKYDYLARPDELSLHNYGAAVDVSIINENGVLLDMGTPFDYFGDLARPTMESQMYEEGKLSKEAYCNRLLLRRIMIQCGFYPITSEWWHFNACNKAYASLNYVLIN